MNNTLGISYKVIFLGCLYALTIRVIDLSYNYTNAKELFDILPSFFVKIWGVFILQGRYIPFLLTSFLFFILVEHFYYRIPFDLKYNLLIPSIISIVFSGLFIMGLGNYYNKLYTRFLIQFIIGLLLGSMHFYLIITRWNIVNDYYFNTPLWNMSLLIFIYAIYTIYDVYACALAKYKGNNYPLFLGVRIDN